MLILRALTTCSGRKQHCCSIDNNEDVIDSALSPNQKRSMQNNVLTDDVDVNDNHNNGVTTAPYLGTEHDTSHYFLSKLILIPASDSVLLSYYDTSDGKNSGSVETFLHLVNDVISSHLAQEETHEVSSGTFLTSATAQVINCKDSYPTWYRKGTNANGIAFTDEMQLASFIVAQMEISIRKAYFEHNNHVSDAPKVVMRQQLVDNTNSSCQSPSSSITVCLGEKEIPSANNNSPPMAMPMHDLYFVLLQPQTSVLALIQWYQDTLGSTATTATAAMFHGLCLVPQPFFVDMINARKKKHKSNDDSDDETATVNNIIKTLLLQYHSVVKDLLHQQQQGYSINTNIHNNASILFNQTSSNDDDKNKCNKVTSCGPAICEENADEIIEAETLSKKTNQCQHQQRQPAGMRVVNTTLKSTMSYKNNNNNSSTSMASIIEKSIEETIASIEASTNTNATSNRASKINTATVASPNTKHKSGKKKRKKGKTNKQCCQSQLQTRDSQEPSKKRDPHIISTNTNTDTYSNEGVSQKVLISPGSTEEQVGVLSCKKQQASQGNEAVVNIASSSSTGSSAQLEKAELTSHSSSTTATATNSVVVTLLRSPSKKSEGDEKKRERAKDILKQDSATHNESSSSNAQILTTAVSDSDSWEVVERKIRSKKTTSKTSQQQGQYQVTTTSASIATSTTNSINNTNKHHIHHRRQRSSGTNAVSASALAGNGTSSTNNRSSRRKSASRQISRLAKEILSQIINTVIDDQQLKKKSKKGSSHKVSEATARKRRDQEVTATIVAARKVLTSIKPQKNLMSSPDLCFAAATSKDINATKAVTNKTGDDVSPAIVAAEATPPTQNFGKQKSTFLPVPAFLGVNCSNNSASSSVSSSLDAPNISVILDSSGKNGSAQSEARLIEGYHLLDVCDRLSADIAVFMRRRAAALELRRSQIQHLMKVMHNTVSSIWDGNGVRVEVMGSCATLLDLPSSDLDLVVCGIKNCTNVDEPVESFPYHTHPNAHFVLRLAAELEKKPWAVQTKPIATASVPVVKILVDPSRLSSTTNELDSVFSSDEIEKRTWNRWKSGIAETNQKYNPATEMQKLYRGNSHLENAIEYGDIYSVAPWRGAGLPNGFLSVDITFEGHGHGGIGSTTYAATVVQEACDEFKLPPEETPTVQLIMVIKELLAQRKLNEPFSGGLSSYSVLLMICAAIREARALREELAAVAKEPQQRCEAPQALPFGTSNFEDLKSYNDALHLPVQELSAGNSSTMGSKSASWALIARNGGSGSSNGFIDQKTRSALAATQLSPTTKASAPFGDKTASSKRLSKSEPTLSTEMSTTVCPTVTLSLCSEDAPILRKSFVAEESLKLMTKPRSSVLFQGAGTDDILEVLCSGEPTSGKLLMYFLLFYGKLFNAQTTVVDMNAPSCPFVTRQAGGSIDPVSGVFTVDPIIIYDPLEGEEGHNVARSCFAWYNIRQVFSQCYATLTQSLEGRGHHRNLEKDDGSHILALILSY
jgi:hypothetical protein